jgi:glycosyltransferase involved in cell wall biosynthesis
VKDTVLIVTPHGARENLENFPEFLLARDLAGDHQVHFVTSPDPLTKTYNIPNLTIHHFRHRACVSPELARLAIHLRPHLKAVIANHLRSDFNWTLHTLKKLGLISAPILLAPQGILHDDFLFDDRQNPLKERPKIEAWITHPLRALTSSTKGSWRNYAWHAPLFSADRVICIAPHEQTFLIKHLPEIKTVLIPNGVPRVEIKTKMNRHSLTSIVFIGQLKRRKGYDVFLQVAEKLLREPGLKIDFITVTPKIPTEHADLFAHLQKVPGFTLHRNISATTKEALFDAADVLIAPSRYEGFGLPIVEAWQREVIVLASNVPAINEILTNDLNGLLIGDYENPGAWLTAWEKLKTMDLNRLRHEGLKRAQDFDVSHMTHAYRQLMRELCQ